MRYVPGEVRATIRFIRKCGRTEARYAAEQIPGQQNGSRHIFLPLKKMKVDLSEPGTPGLEEPFFISVQLIRGIANADLHIHQPGYETVPCVRALLYSAPMDGLKTRCN